MTTFQAFAPIRARGLRSQRRTARPVLFASSALVGLAALGASPASAQAVLPTGGAVTSGNASIATGAASVTVTQTTDRAVVNWTGFDVGQGRTVTFDQPGVNSATLNRVTGGASSTIAGNIVSNGAVYLVNPNGIAITSTGNVQTGGGFVASTLDIADGDFTTGKLAFTGGGASARVVNGGSITAGVGTYVALLGGSVSNGGTITVSLGKVALGAGERIALDLNGDGFLQVAMPSAGAGAQLIKSGGRIVAAGGRVELKVASVAQAVRDVINVSGSISADSATGNGGSIVLLGGDGGTTRVSGTLTARATGTTGNGGFIETSGAAVDYTGLKVDTSAAHGTTGTWLIDPTDLTVDATAAATIGANLASSNVTLQTTATTATGPGTQTPGNGDITVNSAITWTSANTLSLLAYNDIALNAAITGTAGGLTLQAGGPDDTTGAVRATGAIDVGIFNLTSGDWRQVAGTLPAFAARDFRLNVDAASFVRATGGTGTTGDAYAIGDVYGLQGMASERSRSSSFTLTSDIAAGGTVNWNNGAGFVPIGLSNGFIGSFDGANHVISGLTIKRSVGGVGLFGLLIGNIANVGLVGGSVTGDGDVGSLVGFLVGGSLSNVYATTPVTGAFGVVGGLVGRMSAGSITNAYATGATTSMGQVVGGLIGQLNGGTIRNVYATGTATGQRLIGGLIGVMTDGTVTGAYATGAVTSTNATNSAVGGLIGGKDFGSVSGAYASGRVTGTGSGIGGLFGYEGGSSPSSNNYFDSYSTGRSNASGSGATFASNREVTSDPAQAAAANYAYKASAYAGLPVATGLGTANASGFVFMPGDSTRPFLAFEVPLAGNPGVVTNAANQIVLNNSHQLQLVGYNGATLAAGYALGRNIDLSETGRVVVGTPGSYAGMWAGTGFVAIGTDGIGRIWDGTSFSNMGNFAGFSGGLNGSGYIVDGLTINRTTNSQGLFGFLSGTITNIGSVGGSIRGRDSSGALVGRQGGGAISNVYATGAVSGADVVGGLVGSQEGGTISNAYATGAVSGRFDVGGLVGSQFSGAVSDAYATGAVTGTAVFGGLVGGQQGTFSNAYWDSYSTGQAFGGGRGTPNGATAVTSDPTQSAAANYAYKTSAYGNLTAANWVFFDGQTRPFGAWEAVAPGGAITNSHQFQLIGRGNAAAQAGGYTLGGNIDLAETGRVVVGTPGSYSGMWAGTGFVSLGSDGTGNLWNGANFVGVGYADVGRAGLAGGFSGRLDGGGFTLSNLSVNRAGVQNVGLFGGASGTISNLTVTGNVTGYVSVGGLVGLQQGGSITGVTSRVNVTGSSGSAYVGGLVGFASGTTIRSSSASGTVGATGAAGGLVGLLFNSVLTNSSASAVVNGRGGKTGGLVGIVERSTVTGGSSTGTVNGTAGGTPFGVLRDGGTYNGITETSGN